MSVAVTYAATCTVAETLGQNTGSAPAAQRLVTHSSYNQAAALNGATTPPATTCAHFLLALTAGAATIDLRNLTGTNGAVVDGNGLKVQVVRIKNLGANAMTVKSGAANGHTGFFTPTTGTIIPPGAHIVIYTNDNGDDVDATHKTWDVTGTGTQTAEVTIVLG
jgi:hypothetical protein